MDRIQHSAHRGGRDLKLTAKEFQLLEFFLPINEELFSSYVYLAMAAHFENMDLEGFASWMRHRAQEEVDFRGLVRVTVLAEMLEEG